MKKDFVIRVGRMIVACLGFVILVTMYPVAMFIDWVTKMIRKYAS